MKIKVEYKNKELEVVSCEEYHIQDYCHLLSQRVLSVLYQVEDVLNNKIEFRQLRHFLFDLAGDIGRLPDNILDNEQSENIKMKTPSKSFFDFLKRKDD